MIHPTVLHEIARSTHDDMLREASRSRLARQVGSRGRPSRLDTIRVAGVIGLLLALTGAVLLA